MAALLDIWRLLRRRRTGARPIDAVMVGCFALATMLLVLTAGANLGLDARASRTAWRQSPETGEAAVARLITVTDRVAPGGIVRTLYGPGPDAPLPPGLDRQIQPGERFVSPALAELAQRDPQRYGRYAEHTGLLDDDGLARPDELAAVEGAAFDDARFSAPALGAMQDITNHGPVAIDRFAATPPPYGDAALYRLLAALGSVMVAIPALSMVAAASRTVATRKGRELATARLFGARTGQLAVLAALDVAVAAALGAVIGVVAALPLAAALAQVPVQGGRWFVGDLVPPVPVMILMAVVVGSLAIGSAIATIGRVSRDPLGVVANRRRRSLPGTVARLAGFAAVLGFFVITAGSESASDLAIVMAWVLALAGIGLVGPVVVRLVGWLALRASRSGAGVVASRRLLDDPAGIYRQIGPLALAAFVAGLLAAGSGEAASFDSSGGRGEVISVTFPADTSPARIDEALAQVSPFVVDPERYDEGSRIVLELPLVDPDDVGEVRSRLLALDPELLPLASSELGDSLNLVIEDFSRASLVLLFVVALSSAAGAVALGVGGIIDQQRPLTALRTIGVPLAVIRSARRRAVLVPLTVSTFAAGSTGIVLLAVFQRDGIDPGPFLPLALFVAAAVGLAAAAEAGLGRFLDRSTADRRVLEV